MRAKHQILDHIIRKSENGEKLFAWLIDPDKYIESDYRESLMMAEFKGVDYILVGGSLLMADKLDSCITSIKEYTRLPIILFPSGGMQVNSNADALFFLSLISGRNPEFLIGKQVEAAPVVKQSQLECLPTGYMLIDCGRATTASYISNTVPLPVHKPDLAAATAMAGEMLGLKILYLDAGSGADNNIAGKLIKRVKQSVNLPIIVGGGIRNEADIVSTYESGADMVVIGTYLEEEPTRIEDLNLQELKATFADN